MQLPRLHKALASINPTEAEGVKAANAQYIIAEDKLKAAAKAATIAFEESKDLEMKLQEGNIDKYKSYCQNCKKRQMRHCIDNRRHQPQDIGHI